MMRVILGFFQMTGPHCPCPSSVSLEYLILMYLLYAAAVLGQSNTIITTTTSTIPMILERPDHFSGAKEEERFSPNACV